MQTELGLTVIGLAIIATTVGILIRGRTNPVIPMTLIPVAGALLAGFSIPEIGDFFGAGLESVMNVVVMFIFAIIYFGIMQDAGLFTPIIEKLIRMTRGHVVLVTIGTAAIAIIAHLDGAGASTFLITIPALLPLYKAMHISRYILLAIVALSASVMNMVPWAGPVGRAATTIGVDPDEIWRELLPIQGASLVMVFAIAAVLGYQEMRRINKLTESGVLSGTGSVDVDAVADDFVRRDKQERLDAGVVRREAKWITALNVVLTVVVVVTLVTGVIGPAPVFLIATSVALLLNFSTAEDQSDTLKRHAPSALAMAGVLLAAAMFLGVLNASGMLEAIAITLVGVLPAAVGPYIHIIVGLLGVPLDLLTSTDAYYFSILPVVEQTAGTYGVSAMGVALALIIGNIIGTFVSPFSPALWLGIGLAQANMGKHIRVTFPIAWGFSVIMVLFAWSLGMLT